MSNDEPTEMAGAAEAETGSIYAWGLDRDDVDEVPTQRLTPRRITSLSVVASCPRSRNSPGGAVT